jgi:hypothetical protein
MTGYRNRLLRFAMVLLGLLAAAFNWPAQALAAPFQNLDFESAVIGTPVGPLVPASQALPYWTSGNYNPGYVLYDTMSAGSVAVSLHDYSSTFILPLQGQYSVMLQNGLGGPTGSPEDAWISQAGDVPSNAHSLMFSTDYIQGANLVVSLNGGPIPMSLYSVGPVINAANGPVETYIGDISAFAGQQDVTLRFETVPILYPSFGEADLDAIQFSTIVVPEPSALILVGAGLLSLAGYFWKRRAVASRLR